MDAITLLKNDHKTVEQLFRRFEKAGDGAHSEKREIVDRIIEELSIHAAIEEQFFYPVARATVPGTEDVALESIEEHHIVKWVLSELEGMDPSHERFDAKVTVLMENVRHHVEEEETEFFPMVRDALGRAALGDLGEALESAKVTAPTHPHPRSPDTPPGNSVVGTIAGVVDRVGDNLSGLAQGGVSAVQELITRVLGNAKPAPAPTGSSIARGRANDVRRAASSATTSARRTAGAAKKSAGSAARGATRAAGSTAKRTASTAKSAASTAKRSASTGRSAASGAAKKASSSRTAASTRSSASTTKRAPAKAASTTKRTAAKAASTTKRAPAKAASTTKRAASATKRAGSATKRTPSKSATKRSPSKASASSSSRSSS